MDIKAKIIEVLRNSYGNYDSFLEIEYENKLTEKLIVGDLRTKKAWVTYNQVILELKFSLRDNLRVKQLQYNLTENSNPNLECLRLIESVDELTPELSRLYDKIKNLY
jgi:hypothetical protein|tara:strand:+ start:736 stop:1059 length:324 start_codon:yes stop_codon:yes gene_type:complete